MGRIRFALPCLSRAPLLSLVVVGSLGLGIGVNTAIFSLLHQVVLRALPVPHPEQIVMLTAPGSLRNGRSSDNDSGNMDYIFNWHTFRELEKHTEAADVAGFRAYPGNLAFERESASGLLMMVSGRYFSVLGVQPFAGRLIAPEDDVPGGGNPVAVVSWRYFNEKLGAIVGLGLGIGVPAALAASRVFEGRLFGVQGRDAATVAAATMVLTLTAVAAAWWPSRRASRIDPLDALRYE